MRDLRYAFQTLRKEPNFSLVAILTLTLGIGANAAILSVIPWGNFTPIDVV
jgi:putative ABC transport system permease protein